MDPEPVTLALAAAEYIPPELKLVPNGTYGLGTITLAAATDCDCDWEWE